MLILHEDYRSYILYLQFFTIKNKNSVNIMNFGDFFEKLIAKLLSEQMDTGEFGQSRSLSIVNVVSPYHRAYVRGKKANSFVTMYSIEVLHKLGIDSARIRKAISWFYSRISEDGYFLSDVSIPEQVEDLVTGQLVSTQSTIKIFRHTAEALYSLFLIDGVARIPILMLENLLKAQNPDGGWSASSSNTNSQLLSTSFALKAITAINSENIVTKGYAQYEQEEKKKDIDIAISRAIRWLAHQSNSVGGLWYLGIEREENKAFYSGIILGMTPQLFIDNLPDLTAELVDQLIMCSSNGIWLRKNKIDIDGSARILAALIKLRKVLCFDFDFNNSFSILQKEVEKSIENIDPATLCFLIDSLFEFGGGSNEANINIVNAVVSIYDKEKLLGTGFILRLNTQLICLTCRHIFKNVKNSQCIMAFCDGSKINFDVDFLDSSLFITTHTKAHDDICVIKINKSLSSNLTICTSFNDKLYSSFGYGASTKGRGQWNRDLILMGQAAQEFYEMRSAEKILEGGCSGSPIFNSKYEVVGMVQAIKDKTVYIIPSKVINHYLNKLEQSI